MGIHDYAAVGPGAANTARRVGIVTAQAAVRGVAVDHGIHVAGRDAEQQVGPAEGRERCGAVPVGLCDHANTKSLRFEDAPDDGHAEARVIDVSVARHDDDVAAVPAERLHLGPRHGQERGRAEALGPVLAVAGDVACRLHG